MALRQLPWRAESLSARDGRSPARRAGAGGAAAVRRRRAAGHRGASRAGRGRGAGAPGRDRAGRSTDGGTEERAKSKLRQALPPS